MPNNQIQPGHEDIQRGHHVFPARHTNTTIGGQQMQSQQGQDGQGGQGQSRQFPTEDVIMGVDVNVPYDQNVAGDPQETLWDHMANAVKPDLTPNKNKGNGVLGTMDVNQGGSNSSGQ